jgi:hypothetical protein
VTFCSESEMYEWNSCREEGGGVQKNGGTVWSHRRHGAPANRNDFLFSTHVGNSFLLDRGEKRS